MLILTVENLSHSYGERTLFKNVNFNIETGDKIGLIGINGTGKSTLLRYVANLDGGSEGKVVTNGSCIIEYLPQDPPFDPEATVLDQVFRGSSPMMRTLSRYEKAVEQVERHPEDRAAQQELMAAQAAMDDGFAWQIESEAKAVLMRLGISDFNKKMGELSGGQRKRVALAGVLVRPSDLLILDEPTNHMDNGTVAWLEGELKKRKGALLMVTHDRYFFDRVINRTLELDNGTAYLYVANYSGFLAKREERRQLENAAARKLQNIYRRELAWISRGAEARRTKKKDRVERFHELEAEALAKETVSTLEMSSVSTRLGKTVIEMEKVGARYGDTWFLKDFSHVFLRDDRIGIVGPNGVGKTTLMDMIAGVRQPDSGTVTVGQTVKIGYFSQHSVFPDSDKRVLEYIRDAGEYVYTADGSRVSAAQMLERFLFPPELQWVPVSKLSGGEKRRLYLLSVLMEAPNVLLLDEPTNDLDIPTLSVLEEYLEDFAGVVIAVSHDRYFLDRFAGQIFAFENGRIRKVPGGYSDYERLTAREDLEQEDPRKSGGKTPKGGSGKAGGAAGSGNGKNSVKAVDDKEDNKEKEGVRTITFTEKAELERLEQDIAACEAEGKMLSVEIEQAGNDFTRLAELTAKLEENQRKLDRMVERWAFLGELPEA
mgnify:FL=1